MIPPVFVLAAVAAHRTWEYVAPKVPRVVQVGLGASIVLTPGLAHIIAKHGGEFDVNNLQGIMDDMEPTAVQPRTDHMELESEKYHATVRLSRDGQAKKWMLTAFDRTEPPSAKGRSIVPGTPGGGKTGPLPEGGPVPLSPDGGSGPPGTSIAPGGDKSNLNSLQSAATRAAVAQVAKNKAKLTPRKKP